MAEQDTSIGAGQSAFARTRWTEILRARTEPPAAVRDLVERLAAVYWRPVYKFIRVALRKGNEEAKDLTQDFFTVVFQPEWIARADPARGSFRTFLLASLKNFVRDSEKYQGARKRGGGLRPIPIEDAREEAASEGLAPEKVFLRSWAEAVLAEALRELRDSLDGRGREKVFQAFREFCIDSAPGQEVSYRAVAAKLGLSEGDVTNYLSEARRELRRILVGKVGQYAGSPREIDEELRELFGA